MVFQEDIENAVDKAITILGPQGTYAETEYQNVLVSAGNLGELWYGDASADALQNLSNTLKYEVSVKDRSRDKAQCGVFYPTE